LQLRICGTDLFLRICSARSATKFRLRIRNFRHNEAESQQVLPSRPLARLSSKRWLEISLGSTLEHGVKQEHGAMDFPRRDS